MKKRIEQLKEIIKNLKKTDRGRALLFFLGYLLFFIIVFIFMHTSSGGNLDRSDYEKGNTIGFNVDEIMENNYSYKYTITLDINDYVFAGKRNGDLEEFIYDDDTAAVVLEKFKRTGNFNMPVITRDRKYIGFVSKAKFLSEYQMFIADNSED